MKKVLIIVHLEPDFDVANGGLAEVERLVRPIIRFANEFDQTINITSAEALTGTEPFPEIQENFADNREWIWGFDGDYAKIEWPEKILGEDYIETTGHEYSEVLDWMKELSKSDSYTIVGGSRWECLQDIAEIFDHLELNYEIEENLTYGR